MDRSNKHGPRMDDALSGETESLERGGHEPRVEEWREAEPAGEGQPIPDARLSGDVRVDDPYPELSVNELEHRSELSSFLGKEVWPADRDRLLEVAADNNATDAVLGELRSLPAGEEFENLQAVWHALGHEGETHRF